jgi:hypothetical protein
MKTISWNLEKSTLQKTRGDKDSNKKHTEQSFSQKFVSAGVVIGRKAREGGLSPAKKTHDPVRLPANPTSNRADRPLSTPGSSPSPKPLREHSNRSWGAHCLPANVDSRISVFSTRILAAVRLRFEPDCPSEPA